MGEEEYDRYKKIAQEHADFLCEKVFKPAFVMAFVHGAKHMKEDDGGDNPMKSSSPQLAKGEI
jgi:hypothetical protein